MSDREELAELVSMVDDSAEFSVGAKANYLGVDAPSVSVQMLPGSRWLSRYIDGSGIRQQPIAIKYRTSDADSNDRSGAVDAMFGVVEYLESADDMPDNVHSITGTDTPTLIERSDDGTAVWSTTIVVESYRSAASDVVS